MAGVTVTAGQRSSYPAGTGCFYSASRGVVTVQLFSAPGTPQVAEANKDQVGADVQPVSGVGDLAYYSMQDSSIGVLAHGVMFIIGAVNNGQPVSEDVLIAAAQRAASRL